MAGSNRAASGKSHGPSGIAGPLNGLIIPVLLRGADSSSQPDRPVPSEQPPLGQARAVTVATSQHRGTPSSRAGGTSGQSLSVRRFLKRHGPAEKLHNQ